MAARNRLPPWHEELRLSNGRDVLIRPIRPDDAAPLRAGFDLMQPEEIRQRFLSPSTELTPEMAERLTRPHPRREFALVVAEPLAPGEAVIGAVGRATIHANGRDAEFAILVSHHIADMGLGRHLMQRIVRWSRGKKLDRLYGDVLQHNDGMLNLAVSMAFQPQPVETPGLVRVVLELKQGTEHRE